MKNYLLSLTFAVTLCLCLASGGKAADSVHQQTSEYATIRWSGRDNTHVIRPSGQVEFVGAQLAKIKKPDRVDDRAFYMNVVMNALAKEGYEFAGISNDEIIMKRAVHH
jgi:gamma-glutamylcysteine synthetase